MKRDRRERREERDTAAPIPFPHWPLRFTISDSSFSALPAAVRPLQSEPVHRLPMVEPSHDVSHLSFS